MPPRSSIALQQPSSQTFTCSPPAASGSGGVQRPKAAPPIGGTSSVLLRACKTAEHLAECALADDRRKVFETIGCLPTDLAASVTLIHRSVTPRIDERMKAIRLAVETGKLNRTALETAELYRLLHRELAGTSFEVPLRVYLLNYVGLKLVALSREAPCDWTAIAAAASDASMHCERLDASLREASLLVMVDHASRQLSDGLRAMRSGQVGSAGLRFHAIARVLERHLSARNGHGHTVGKKH